MRAVGIGATFQLDAHAAIAHSTAAFIVGAAGACTRAVAIAAYFAVLFARRNTRAAIANLANAAVRRGCTFRRWWSVANASDAVVGAAQAIARAAGPVQTAVIAWEAPLGADVRASRLLDVLAVDWRRTNSLCAGKLTCHAGSSQRSRAAEQAS